MVGAAKVGSGVSRPRMMNVYRVCGIVFTGSVVYDLRGSASAMRRARATAIN